MERSGQNRRRVAPNTDRAPFGVLVGHAIRRRITESSGHETHWCVAPNVGWARWRREDGRFVYCAIRRRLDWLTAELGAAPAPLELDHLELVHAIEHAHGEGCRIQLGMLTEGHDKWWSSGGTEKALNERLDWLAQQMRLRMHAFMTATVRPAA
jgi:hypothetical protein